jgi:isopentenyl-diphosphate delta-isomerase
MIHERKHDHVEISLEKPVESRISTGFDDIIPVHRCLPEINLDKIDLSQPFFGKTLKAPLVISGMTGGHDKAKKINENLAIAAQELGVALGVGSQRAGIENKELVHTYSVAREAAPEAFLIANLGAVQLVSEYGVNETRAAVEMIEADALAVHLNPLQEAIQPEGDRDFKGCLEGISRLRELEVPIIAKETGAGISRADALSLKKAGVAGFDVGGLGGTSFAAVEFYREGVNKELAKSFWDWGIPTAASAIEVLASTKLPVICAGGLRSGIDVAKALSLGSVAAGMALPFLEAAVKGPEAVEDKINQVLLELRTAMFLMGAEDVKSLLKSDILITGATREWLEARNIDYKKFSNRGDF